MQQSHGLLAIAKLLVKNTYMLCLEQPPKTDEKSLVNHQYLSRGLIYLAQVWYIYSAHDARPTTKVQYQRVKDQGHSVT